MRSIPIFALIALLSVWSCQESASTAESETSAEEAAPVKEARPPRSQTIEEVGLASPESVIGDGTYLYVSNVGRKLEPSKKDGDGFISRLDGEGNVVDLKFMTGLDAPKGSAIVDGTFYVADIDKVRKYNLATGEALGAIDFAAEEVNFLNDIAAGPEGSLFVTSTDKSKIFQINTSDDSYSVLATSTPVISPNGLWFDAEKNHLYVVTFDGENGRSGRLNLNKSPAAYELLDNHLGSLDGVAKIGDYLLVSDWKKQSLVILDINDGGRLVQEHPMSVRIQGPADFYWDEANGELWVPGMQMNKIFVKTSAIQ